MRVLPGRFCALILLMFWGSSHAQQGTFYPATPHGYWYFFSPTGFSPPPKQTLFQNGLVAISQYQKTSANGNTTTCLGIIPTLLLGDKYMPIWVSAHRRFPIGGTKRNPKAIANLGGFFLSLPPGAESQKDRDFSMFYLNCTFGNREKNFAIGGAIIPTGLGEGITPQAITLHGMTRLGKRSCLLTENYIVHDRGDWIPISINGWRGWKGRTAFDIGLMLTRVPSGSSVSKNHFWLPLPWLAVHRVLRFDIFDRGDE